MQPVRQWLLCGTILLLLAPSAALGRQLLVSKDGLGAYRSVEGAMRDASAGDTILVGPGTYEESIQLRNGVTVLGSGASQTIIRYGYGFDPVLRAENIVSGRIERVTLERMPSILDAPAVHVESAQLTFVDCTISGGRSEGILVRGLGAQVALEDCDVIDNGGFGILCEAEAQLHLVRGRVARNGAAGVLVVDGGCDIDGTSFDANGGAGLLLERFAIARLEDSAFFARAGWAVELYDDARLVAERCFVVAEGAGGVRLADRSEARISGMRIEGGQTGVEAAGASTVEIVGGGVRGAIDAGVRVMASAACGLEAIEIADCAGHGLDLASEASVTVRRATIAGNEGDGVLVRGGSVEVTNSIVAMNGGAGLHIVSGASLVEAPLFAYNAVWGNAEDYVNTTRRPSDVAEAPGFADPDGGDYSLRLDSPCLGSGARGATIGSHPDPTRAAGASVEVRFRQSTAFWGLTVGAEIRVATVSPHLRSVVWELAFPGERSRFSLSSALLGAGGERVRTEASVCILECVGTAEDGTAPSLRATLAARGILDGAASRFSLSATAELAVGALSCRTWSAWEQPTGILHHEIDLGLGGLALSAAAVGRTLTRLDASATIKRAIGADVLSASAALAMLPAPVLRFTTDWRAAQLRLEADGSIYLDDLSSGGAAVRWSDAAGDSTVELRGEVGNLAVTDVSLRAATRAGPLSFEAEVGVHASMGARLRLRVVLEGSRRADRTANAPPVAAFGHTPDDPQAGEPVAFDASSSFDSDGELVEYWWDFGDGAVDIGNPITHRYEDAGTYLAVLTVTDAGGATASIEQPIVVFETDTRPVASFTWGPVSAAGTSLLRPLRAGDLVRLDATTSRDPAGSIVEFAWDFESDGVFDRVAADPRITIDPFRAGTWPVTLRVTSSTGRSDAVMRVLRVDEPKPPQAAFDVSPALPSIYDPVRFIDRSVGIEAEIIAWEWSFGDGHASREPSPIHRFEESGQYDVRLTVTDSLGLAAAHGTTLDVGLSPGVVPVADVWALVIGISDYQEVDDLLFARRDGEAVARWLLANGVPPEHIRLLTDGRTEPDAAAGLSARSATLVNVREALGWLRRVAGKDDLVVIHFSGHGYQGADDDGDEADGLDEFLILHDTRADAKDDTALRDDEFGRFLDRIASDHVLITFDSCYSGGLSRSLGSGRRASGDPQDWFGDLRMEGRLVLAAASEGEQAFESAALGHGVFTHFLLDGLEGSADVNGDFHVTVWELYEYVSERVPEFVRAERGESQRPQLLGDGETRIILSLRDRPLEARFSYCPSIPYAGGPVMFLDESSSATVRQRVWTFGDGAEEQGERVEHVFAAPGRFPVRLSVSDESGSTAEALMEVEVIEPGRVLALDAAMRRIVISLGRSNGLALGDQFTLERASEDPDSAQTVLEVVELIDDDRAACAVLFAESDPHLGDALLPLQVGPCR